MCDDHGIGVQNAHRRLCSVVAEKQHFVSGCAEQFSNLIRCCNDVLDHSGVCIYGSGHECATGVIFEHAKEIGAVVADMMQSDIINGVGKFQISVSIIALNQSVVISDNKQVISPENGFKIWKRRIIDCIDLRNNFSVGSIQCIKISCVLSH
ncbi:hypothetical protein SDC9_102501 [bioreactor metagenome]|uniref:Uncharacterized protein n=1 Tax=bioreactor metagenome TaxID=1076179 RepID=A0A645B1W0_9ZZZZ